jgi:hypothetical protein
MMSRHSKEYQNHAVGADGQRIRLGLGVRQCAQRFPTESLQPLLCTPDQREYDPAHAAARERSAH